VDKGYANFLSERKLAPPKHQSLLAVWGSNQNLE